MYNWILIVIYFVLDIFGSKQENIFSINTIYLLITTVNILLYSCTHILRPPSLLYFGNKFSRKNKFSPSAECWILFFNDVNISELLYSFLPSSTKKGKYIYFSDLKNNYLIIVVILKFYFFLQFWLYYNNCYILINCSY